MPLIRSAEYRLAVNSLVPAHPCTATYEGLEKGRVLHYLPGENPFIKELRQRYGISSDVPTAGAETMYPEFKKKLRDSDWSRGSKGGSSGAGGIRPVQK